MCLQLASLLVVAILAPWLLLLFPVIAIVYCRIQTRYFADFAYRVATAHRRRRYRANSRELRRLDMISRSPIFQQFQETFGGLETIRAYRQEPLLLGI
jgi:ABC-type multidrug transport system fused ATPase/permease subunit